MQRQGRCAQRAVEISQFGIDDYGRLLKSLWTKLPDRLAQGAEQSIAQRDQGAGENNLLRIEERVNPANYPSKRLRHAGQNSTDQLIALSRGFRDRFERNLALFRPERAPPAVFERGADAVEDRRHGGDFLQRSKLVARPGYPARAPAAGLERGDRAQTIPDLAGQIVPAVQDIPLDHNSARAIERMLFSRKTSTLNRFARRCPKRIFSQP